MESHKRSIAKAASYRFIGSLITGGIAFALSGQLNVALGVGFFDAVLKTGVYFFHERAWARIKWGTPKHPPDYQI